MSAPRMAAAEQETNRARTGAATMAPQRCWSSTLPDDLLVVIYGMIASPCGRARFAAVCRSWHTAAREASPVTPLPWLLLSRQDGNKLKRLHCPEDGTAVDLDVGVGVKTWLAGAHDDGWVVSSTLGSLRVVNLFSGAEVMLSEKQARVVCEGCRHGPRKVFALKIVFSEPPTSDSCILAAMTRHCGVALCRVGCANGGWTVQGCPRKSLVDITFCNGELYGLHYEGAPAKFDISVNEDGAPIITGEHRLAMQRINRTYHKDHYMDYASYIFDLQGKLAMASSYRRLSNLKPFFKVFKLVDICIGGSEAHCKHKWLEVTSLGDHALFLGYQFSKAIHMPTNMRGGVERNCIYYSHHCHLGPYDVIPSDKVFLTISNDIPNQTYYKEDDTKKDVAGDDLVRIRSVGYFKKGDLQGGMWILPPHI